MKITELRCKSCNGTLEIDEKDPGTAVCEYCRTKYSIEQDKEETKLTEIPKMQYRPRQYAPAPKHNVDQRVIYIVAGFAFVVITFIVVMVRPAARTPEPAGFEVIDEYVLPTQEMQKEEVALTGCLKLMAESAFGQPGGDIPQAELDKIRWIEERRSFDNMMIGYSFDNPLENDDAALTWVTCNEDEVWGNEGLVRFCGLKKLEGVSGWELSSLGEIELESVGGYFDSPAEAAELIGNPETIKELLITGGLESLEGLELFPNLERLAIEGSDLTEIKEVVSVKNLKHLTLNNFDNLRDFSVFSVLGNLESLRIESELLKDLGFIQNMNQLRKLEVADAAIISVDVLALRPELESLVIEDCDELKDLGGVTGLVNLKNLSIELPYNCPEPDLGRLIQLESLTLAGFKNCSFLRNLVNLRTLTMDNCAVENRSELAGLVNLKELTCTAFIGMIARDYRFISSVPALERLDIRGMSTYEDISGFFNIPTLKELNISGMECEINFSKLTANPNLEILKMDGLKLYKNVQVSGYGGIQYVDWDNVILSEHLNFLSNYQGLKQLSIADNELTSLEFTAALPTLESIDFTDNYITDLKPLVGLTHLKEVICSGNPISNYRILGDGITLSY